MERRSLAHKSKRGSATHSDTHGPARGLTARRPPSRRSERFSAPGAERCVALRAGWGMGLRAVYYHYHGTQSFTLFFPFFPSSPPF
ncbi:MAG: hypothetical protein ACPIOQ_21950, partial [Promethearchaeia archaeon]